MRRTFLLVMGLVLLTSVCHASTTKNFGNRTSYNDYPGTNDLRVNSNQHTTNYDTETELPIQANTGDVNNLLVQFTGLSNIPAGATITAAALHLYLRYSDGVGTFQVDMHRVLRNWVFSQVTWDNYSTGNAWTTGGAVGSGTDMAATETDHQTSDGSKTGQDIVFSSAQLIADIQGFVNGTYTNYGWVFYRDSGVDSHYHGYSSSRYSTGSQLPYLSVTWTPAATTLGSRSRCNLGSRGRC